MQLQRVRRRDPEVATATTPPRPRQVWVEVFGRLDNLRRARAVGHHDLGGDQVVAGQAEVAGEQSEAASGNHTTDAPF